MECLFLVLKKDINIDDLLSRQKEFDLQDISLLIFDECHHTMKEHPYKQIMDRYFEIKHMNSKRLPQVISVTGFDLSRTFCWKAFYYDCDVPP